MHLIKKIILILLIGVSFQTGFSQRGKDGSKTVTSSEIVNEYTSLTASASLGASIISVQNSSLNGNGRFSGVLQKGDLLFIYNVQGIEINGIPDPGNLEIGSPNNDTWGAVTAERNCGLYEFAEVKSIISATQIELACGLKFAHNIGSFNEKVLIVRVPRYQDLTVNTGGEITCDNWDGQIGGAVIIEVVGVTVVDGEVNASEKGFRGGEVNADTPDFVDIQAGDKPRFGGEKGEGVAGYKSEYNIFGGAYGRGAAANAGGGGNSHNGGGAGGANASKSNLTWTGKGIPLITTASWATAWNLEQAGLATTSSSGGGRGGYCWSTNNGDALVNGPADAAWGGHNRANFGGNGGRALDYSGGRIFYGGGGGSGHQNNSEGGSGGNGGGLIFLSTYGNVTGSGKIVSNGEDGTGSQGKSAPFSGQANKDGSGGGGAGGAVLVQTFGMITTISFETKGGLGGTQILTSGAFGGAIVEAQGPGGGGSGGYIGLSNLGLISDLEGGVNGTTNSPSLSEFPANGATKGDTGLIEIINPNTIFFAEDDTICGGGSVTITPTIIGPLPTPSGQLDWFTSYTSSAVIHTGNTFTTPVLAATTTYYFGGCGITYRDSVTIFASPLIVIDTNNMILQNESCLGNDGSITAITTTGGIGTLKYYWNNAPSLSLDTTNLSGGTFNLVAIDSVGCSDTINNIVITSINPPTIDTSWMVLVKDSCLNNTGELNGIIVTGGSGSFLYSVDGNVVPSLNINGLAGGTHQVIVLDNNNGCEDTVDIFVGSVLPPSITLGNDTTMCTGLTLSLDGTTAGATYIWQDASTNPTFDVTANGLYWVEVSIGSCSDRDSINVVFTNGQPINLGNDTTLCSGETINLDATSPGGVHNWQDNSALSTFNVTSAGQYFVEVDVNGCINKDTIDVTYKDIAVYLGDDTTLCDNATLLLDATTGVATYLWNDATISPNLTVSGFGSYWVSVTEDGCTVSDTIKVGYSNSPVINLGNDTLLCDEEAIYLDITYPNSTYLWQDGTTTPNYVINDFGEFYVDVTNSCGVVSDTINVAEKNCACEVFIPNAFSPNGDGFNDFFSTPVLCEFHQFEFKVFNRMGMLVYETVDPKFIWDGSYKGGVNESEIYVWNLKYRVVGEDVEIHFKTGHLTIVR